MAQYPQWVYINGEILPAKDAKISVFDRGFLFGDGIYEVMVRMHGKWLFEEAHLERLFAGTAEIDIHFDRDWFRQEVKRYLQFGQLDDANCLLYMQITRGIAPRMHHYPNSNPSFMCYAIEKELPYINELPYSVTLLPDMRWHNCHLKTTAILGNVMAKDHAVKNKHQESILYREEAITEGSHTNVFFVRKGVVYTHPADKHILGGITRKEVIALCKNLDIPCKEVAVRLKDLPKMEEAFLTGTSTQIAAIKQLDRHTFGNNPITQKLQQAFADLCHGR
ncbi:MAG: aminotransferase class IV [Flavobacteriaceae bacterium]|nr:aminotransferase class IV [Flavobacteriaceae bacterium]